MRPLLLLAAAALILGLAAPAFAAPRCELPKGLAPAPVEPVDPRDVVSGVKIEFYLLAITWTPEWRRMNGKTPAFSPAIDEARRPQGFALHGLWPNGKGPPYPRYCRPVGTIPAATVREMYCRTPSAALLQHEWQAHGACAWDRPEDYFRDAARLYDRIVLPRVEGRSSLTAGELRDAFAKANRGLPRTAVFVAADPEGRLSEVRLCYDTAYRPAACPGGFGPPDERRISLTPSGGRRF